MIIALIVAMGRNRAIGSDGEIPWRLPAEMRYFRQVTLGKPVIMGRKTFESIGKPLAGRHNIVLTKNREFRAPGCAVVHSPGEALLAAGDAAEVMVIGGSEIYRRFLPLAHRLYLTCIEAEFAGDTFFPRFSPRQWRTVWQESHKADAQNAYAFRTMVMERRDATLAHTAGD